MYEYMYVKPISFVLHNITCIYYMRGMFFQAHEEAIQLLKSVGIKS